jgi:hypothetical protein
VTIARTAALPPPIASAPFHNTPIIHGNLVLKNINNKFSPHESLKQRAVKPWAVKGQWFSLFTTMDG